MPRFHELERFNLAEPTPSNLITQTVYIDLDRVSYIRGKDLINPVRTYVYGEVSGTYAISYEHMKNLLDSV